MYPWKSWSSRYLKRSSNLPRREIRISRYWLQGHLFNKNRFQNPMAVFFHAIKQLKAIDLGNHDAVSIDAVIQTS